NMKLFDEIFSNKNYIIGKAILNSLATGAGSMITQITLIGDPVLELTIPKYPDFEIKTSDINFTPQNPLKDDTVSINISIKNLGVVFPDDSVTIEVFKNSVDTSNFIDEIKINSFGQNVNINMPWVPSESGIYDI